MMERSKAIAAISYLLQRGADVRYREKYGRTALHLWCDRADISVDESESAKVVQLLMKQFPGLITARTYTGATALPLAVSRGNVAAVKELMKNGANICLVASANQANMESLKEGAGLTPLTALRIGKFPGSVPEEVLAKLQKKKAAASADASKSQAVALP